ncbi:MAG TPA: D-alanyl-D-alanine carboxypeptidase/D-alanyl-D-alanine-endopeptidase [Polyangiaceae bacterium]
MLQIRRCFGTRISLLACLGVTGICRIGLGEPNQDTLDPNLRVASLSPEQQLRNWATKNQAALSFTVATLPGGAPAAELDGATPRNPASVSKLATAFVALKRLGPSYRWKTTVHGRILGGHAGTIAIRSEGDPSLSSDFISTMAARLAAMGLVAVDGDILVDQSFFDDRTVPPAFEQQPGEWSAFRAPICATALDRNALTLRLIPNDPGSKATLFVEPFGAATWSGEVESVAREANNAAGKAPATGKGRGNRLELRVVQTTQRPELRVAGAIDANAGGVALMRRSEDPRQLVGYVLREALMARGIRVQKAVALGPVGDLPILYAHQSDALSTIVHRLGKESDNFTAEMLLKTLGARSYQTGSSEAGIRVISETLEQAGLPAAEMRWVNGSGLFDANRVSTRSIARLLGIAMSDPTLAPEYIAQLSIAGKDGTLASRLRSLPEGCVVRAKSGTLRTVISLAGYVARSDRQPLGFAIIIENVRDQAAARQQIDRYVASLCSITPPTRAP